MVRPSIALMTKLWLLCLGREIVQTPASRSWRNSSGEPVSMWPRTGDVKYFDGRMCCWWEMEAGFMPPSWSMWRSYQGLVFLRNVYIKQACFRTCWHRAALRLFAFAFDLWTGQWNKGRKPNPPLSAHHCADMQHHAALKSGLEHGVWSKQS